MQPPGINGLLAIVVVFLAILIMAGALALTPLMFGICLILLAVAIYPK